MFDAKSILGQFIGGQGAGTEGRSGGSPAMGGLAGGALAGGLAALLAGTKTGRKVGKNVLAYGGTALVGGLAYKAWRDWRSGQPAAESAKTAASSPAALQAPPADSGFLPAAGQEAGFNRSLIRAMIAAAHADGRIDSEEQRLIFRTVNEMGLSTGEKAFVMDELASPADISAVAAAATCQETAAELYLASLLAIDETGVAERDYLIRLAASLDLEQGLLEHLHASASQARRA
jgi:uncharacterized membrane protein YebE (DUF533 family)